MRKVKSIYAENKHGLGKVYRVGENMVKEILLIKNSCIIVVGSET